MSRNELPPITHCYSMHGWRLSRRVHVLEFTRHPQGFHTALAEHATLATCTRALEAAGLATVGLARMSAGKL